MNIAMVVTADDPGLDRDKIFAPGRSSDQDQVGDWLSEERDLVSGWRRRQREGGEKGNGI